MHPNQLNDLHAAIVEDVTARLPDRLAPKAGGPPGAALPVALGFPDISGAIVPIVREGLDLAARLFGPGFEEHVKANRDAIRQVLSERTLQYVEGLIHDLEDARAGA